MVAFDLTAPRDNQMPQDMLEDAIERASFQDAAGEICSQEAAAIDQPHALTMRHAHGPAQGPARRDFVAREVGEERECPLDVVVEERASVIEDCEEARQCAGGECGAGRERGARASKLIDEVARDRHSGGGGRGAGEK
jgi:hypothetical protein